MEHRNVFFIRDRVVGNDDDEFVEDKTPDSAHARLYTVYGWEEPEGCNRCLLELRRGDIICIVSDDETSVKPPSEMESEVKYVAVALDRLQEYGEDGKATYVHPDQYDKSAVDEEGDPLWWGAKPYIKVAWVFGGEYPNGIYDRLDGDLAVVPHPSLMSYSNKGNDACNCHDRYVASVPFSDLGEKAAAFLNLILLSRKTWYPKE